MFNEIITQKMEEIKNDNKSGSSEFIEKVLDLYELSANFLTDDLKDNKEEIYLLSQKIINARPSMAVLINVVGLILTKLEQVTTDNLQTQIKKFKRHKIELQAQLTKNFKDFLRSTNQKALKLMLISYSSTINDLLLNIKNFEIELYLLESRPLCEGRRTAKILSKKFKVHLIIDAAMGLFIDKVDFVLIGIDSILKDCSIINKVGTYPLAVIAQQNLKKVYAIGTSLKYNLKNHYGKDIKIAKKPNNEVFNNKNILSNSIQVHNYYFDITPPSYITGIITDLGILSPEKFKKEVVNSIPTKWLKDFEV